MKIKKLLIYVSVLSGLILAGGYANVNADSQSQVNNTNFNVVNYPDASNNSEQVENYVESFSNNVKHNKLNLRHAKKQLANSKTKKAKNKAVKKVNKIKKHLTKLNDDKKSILKFSKENIVSAEKQSKKAKTTEEHINANVSLSRAQINYNQLNKDLN